MSFRRLAVLDRCATPSGQNQRERLETAEADMEQHRTTAA